MIGPVSPPRTIGKLINETDALFFAFLFSPLAFLSMSSRASSPVNSDNDFNGLRNAMESEFPRPLLSRRRYTPDYTGLGWSFGVYKDPLAL
ncbi:hypothetical protein B0H16DRAFT_1891487 [Mycena metata]|uniref:Uncharacterized protein n=1 Tax=Mycena metata TaxID=1033252 RepID=A0AAD7I9S6_9AGAR|nr:hypothetical protein B0H16DRAFT_1891487 [Mycena metata]